MWSDASVHGTSKYPKVPKSTQKYLKVPKSTSKYPFFIGNRLINGGFNPFYWNGVRDSLRCQFVCFYKVYKWPLTPPAPFL